MSGPGDGEEIWEGRTRAKTTALNRETAARLISAIGTCERGRVFQALLAATETGCENTKLPDCFVKRGGARTDILYRCAFVKEFGHLDGRDEVVV